MAARFLSFLNRNSSGLHEAALLLALSAVASQILALIRDRLFATTFGAGRTLDIYYASFRIPDLIYVIVASLVATTVLIPFVVDRLSHERRRELGAFLNSVLSFFLVALSVAALAAVLLISALAELLVPGFSEAEVDQFIALSRLLLLSPLLLGLSNLLGSVTQSLRRFFIYALTPVVYNLGIIFGILFLYEPFGFMGLGYGVILGAFLHFFIQVPMIWREGLLPRLTRVIDFSEIKHVILNSLPRTLTVSAHHIIIVVFTALASLMNAGSIAVFNLSYNLQSVPLTIIGVSYSVAAFPTLSQLYAKGEKAHFVKQIVEAGRHIIFWSLPVLALFVVLRAQIVRVILGAGEFDWGDTRLVAAALALFTFSVVAQGLVHLFVRGYYAAGNTRKPLILNALSALVTVVAGFLLLALFDASQWFRLMFAEMFRVAENIPVGDVRVLMLPFAFSIGAVLNMTLIWAAFRKEFHIYYYSIRKSIFQALAGALVMGAVTRFFLEVFSKVFHPLDTFASVFYQGFLAGLGGIIAGVLFFELIGSREYKEIKRALTRKIFRAKPVYPEPEELER